MNQHFAVCGSILAVAVATGALAQQAKLPPLKRQGSPEAVVKEHMAAINACDWKRILAQDPVDVEIFSPDGVLAQGREAVGVMFAQVVKPFHPKNGSQAGASASRPGPPMTLPPRN